MFVYLTLSQFYHTPEAARAVDRDGVDPLFRFSLFRFFAGGSAAAGAGAEGAGALLFLISSHRCSAADAVRRVPIAAAITSHLDRVWLCSA